MAYVKGVDNQSQKKKKAEKENKFKKEAVNKYRAAEWVVEWKMMKKRK